MYHSTLIKWSSLFEEAFAEDDRLAQQPLGDILNRPFPEKKSWQFQRLIAERLKAVELKSHPTAKCWSKLLEMGGEVTWVVPLGKLQKIEEDLQFFHFEGWRSKTFVDDRPCSTLVFEVFVACCVWALRAGRQGRMMFITESVFFQDDGNWHSQMKALNFWGAQPKCIISITWFLHISISSISIIFHTGVNSTSELAWSFLSLLGTFGQRNHQWIVGSASSHRPHWRPDCCLPVAFGRS